MLGQFFKKSEDAGTANRLKEMVAVLRKRDIVKGVTPEKLRQILEDLGPTFVKLGQVMSMRYNQRPFAKAYYSDTRNQFWRLLGLEYHDFNGLKFFPNSNTNFSTFYAPKNRQFLKTDNLILIIENRFFRGISFLDTKPIQSNWSLPCLKMF